MAVEGGWYAQWFAGGWFPTVWFAPGDEEHLTPEERRPEQPLGGGRRVRRPMIDIGGARRRHAQQILVGVILE